MADYVAHAGTGKLSPTAADSYIDAATVASLFGLSPGEYEVGAPYVGTAFDSSHIHLTPRPDGAYRSIKVELGDNGTPYHYDKMVNAKKFHERNNDNDIERNRSR